MAAGDAAEVQDVTRDNTNTRGVELPETNGESAEQHSPLEELPEADEFGLPAKPPRRRQWSGATGGEPEVFADASDNSVTADENGKSRVIELENGSAAVSKPVDSTAPRPTEADNRNTLESGLSRHITLDDAADRPLEGQESASSQKAPKSIGRPNTSQGRDKSSSISEWSHQILAPREDDEQQQEDQEGEWQSMPAYATHRIYDDWGKVLAKEYGEVEDEHLAYSTLGGAGKGYTRVQIDDDAESATSMDDHTAYLFKDPHVGNALDEDEEGRDTVSQMQATKELLTEGQRIAYVGLVRLSIAKMLDELNRVEHSKATNKQIEYAHEAMKMWGQKMMVRLYSHMEIHNSEQVMVEQLTEHGVLPSDLTPALMQNARVANPAKVQSSRSSLASPRPSSSSPVRPQSPVKSSASRPSTPGPASPLPPAYEERPADELTVQSPTQLESKKDLDLDIRWTVLCDLFLLLIAHSTYDARSRTLLEHVGASLSVEWQEICRFEKRVTDALEMQEQADKENWNEEDHLDARRKAARNKRLVVMGLCTVGGGLVIGLSAGLLAPVIGAGLAAGFTTIGVTGTSTFLGGAGAAAMIGGGGALTGGIVGGRASNRRTGSVKTFEYRPLFNNKRPNLIVTVSGWMTGKVDDVRLPFSTVDPVMGDMYSINWEPEMLQSTGQTIQILATEALTQTIQQILGSTILTALMAGLSVPIVLTKLSYLIDNPWTVSLARADATGLILADSLIDRNLGVRPITLVGFSLGSRVIFSCLKELCKRGAMGLVQNVYLFGSPVIAKKDEYIRARTVVSGRFVNGYATNDWILGYLFRATSGGIARVSGLSAVDIAGIENHDVTEMVPGHMAYRVKMPALLAEVGWLVNELDFTEIEDPDPDNHEKRQRELLNEIEAARRELDDKSKDKPKKSGLKSFFFTRKRAPEKKDWEMYDARSQKVSADVDAGTPGESDSANVMFDVDAIRREALRLAIEGGDFEEIKQHLQIREVQSTLPPLKLESPQREALRQTRSFDATTVPAEAVVLANGHLSGELSVESRNGVEKGLPALPNEEGEMLASPVVSRLARPALRSTASSPVAPTASVEADRAMRRSPDRNPWSDADEEEGVGGEKEVSISFE